jgi:hypothetical protein
MVAGAARVSSALVVLMFALAGCATPRPVPQPSEFPLHASDASGFTLHWRLDQTAGAVAAEGVLQSTRLDRYSLATVELAGLDASGSVVSRGQMTATPRDFTGTAPWPFTIQLRPAGSEARFVVRIVSVLPRGMGR